MRAIVFDLDGVLLDSEQTWDEARRGVVDELGGHWREEATPAMQGMSSPEWACYLRDHLAVDAEPERITALVVERVEARYRQSLPIVPGALDTLRRLGSRFVLGLASSSDRMVIDQVLDESGFRAFFHVVISSQEVPRGKPAPDVYLEAVARLGVRPTDCAAVEDSANGIRAASAAGLMVVAIPNRHYPPAPVVVGRADLVVGSLDELTAERLEQLDTDRTDAVERRLDEEEIQSFPASDSHSEWAGPAS